MRQLTEIIGIDPDTELSGVCLLKRVLGRKTTIEELTNLDLFDTLKFIDQHPHAKICIEAGWLNKKTEWHSGKDGRVGLVAKIGSYVGANHEIGKQIEKYCIRKGRDYMLYRPTSHKWDAKLFKNITGWNKRSNQEQRDAVRACWR